MRKEPFIVDLREYHEEFDFLKPGPSGYQISKLPDFKANATGQSKAVDDFIYTINKSTISNPDASFLGVVSGTMVLEAPNISDGDVVVVDRDKKPVSGCVGVYFCNGKYVLRCLGLDWDTDLWGVVVYALRSF